MSYTYNGLDNFPTSLTFPSDGDNKTAASVDVGLEGVTDRTTWLRNHALGNRRLIREDVFTQLAGGNDFSVATSFENFTSVVGTFTTATNAKISIPSTLATDLILVRGWFNVNTAGSAISGLLRIAASFNGGGFIDQGVRSVFVAGSDALQWYPMAFVQVPTSGTTIIAVQGTTDSPTPGPGDHIDLVNSGLLQTELLRSFTL